MIHFIFSPRIIYIGQVRRLVLMLANLRSNALLMYYLTYYHAVSSSSLSSTFLQEVFTMLLPPSQCCCPHIVACCPHNVVASAKHISLQRHFLFRNISTFCSYLELITTTITILLYTKNMIISKDSFDDV
jgi:hypothetical protein